MLNHVQLIGHVGADAESGTTEGGTPWARFRIATSERWKDKSTGEKKEQTEWSTIVVWREALVGVVRDYVKKGQQLYVAGRLQTRKWQDQSGQDRYSTEIVLQDLKLLGRAPRENAPMTPPPSEERHAGGAARANGNGNADHQAPLPRGSAPPANYALDDEIPF